MEQHISRTSPVKISIKEFRETGYALIDSIAEFYENIARYPVTTGETPKQIDALLTNTCLTPADVYFVRGDAILNERKRIKIEALKSRRLEYHNLKTKK